MKKYEYTALDYQGRDRSGQIEAEDELDETQKLKNDGLFPTKVKLSADKVGAPKTEKTILKAKKRIYNILGYKITIEKSLS